MKLIVVAAFAPLSWIALASTAGAQVVAGPNEPTGIAAQALESAPASAASGAPVEASTPSISCCLVPAMTSVEMVFGAAASSRTSKPGDVVPIRLIEPLVVGGREIAALGTTGTAEVIQASKGRMMGKAGELTLAARYLDINGQRLPLKRLRYGPTSGRGADTAVFLTTAMVGLPGLLIAGGNIDVQAGARANAVVAADTVVKLVTP